MASCDVFAGPMVFMRATTIYKRDQLSDQKTIEEKIPNAQNIWSNDSKLHSNVIYIR